MFLLKRKYRTSILFLFGLCASTASSAQYIDGFSILGKKICLPEYHTVIGVSGGYAYINGGTERLYTGTDDEVFTYNTSDKGHGAGFGGVFLGVEMPMSRPGVFAQTGLAYHYFGSINLHGSNTAGIEPATSTPYSYHYREQTQQLLFQGKVFATFSDMFHPYLLAGLGAAFNRASDFNISTTQAGSVNLTPVFGSHTNTAFSYAFGIGMDMDIYPKVRVGVGYQFNHFGKAEFDKGQINYQGYQYPVSYGLGSHVYANEVIVDLSYTI